MPKITKRLVDRLQPDDAGRDVFQWDAGDGALKGFGVRVKPSGVASYFVQYRNQEGRTRRLVLGRVGELTPDEARALAADKLKGVRKGADPSADRHVARTALTVAELCDLYLADAGERVKASTLAMDRSRIECHVKPQSRARIRAAPGKRLAAAVWLRAVLGCSVRFSNSVGGKVWFQKIRRGAFGASPITGCADFYRSMSWPTLGQR
jgi:Arm DNA-binding domain